MVRRDLGKCCNWCRDCMEPCCNPPRDIEITADIWRHRMAVAQKARNRQNPKIIITPPSDEDALVHPGYVYRGLPKVKHNGAKAVKWDDDVDDDDDEEVEDFEGGQGQGSQDSVTSQGQGSQDSVGSQGSKGSVGSQGSKGSVGSLGSQGSQNSVGSRGSQGSAGSGTGSVGEVEEDTGTDTKAKTKNNASGRSSE